MAIEGTYPKYWSLRENGLPDNPSPSPPMTHRTMTDPTEPGVLQLQFRRQVIFGWVSGELQYLRTICDSFSVPVMSVYRTAGAYIDNVVGFAAVAVPRLIFG
jgi:hypothetical protein